MLDLRPKLSRNAIKVRILAVSLSGHGALWLRTDVRTVYRLGMKHHRNTRCLICLGGLGDVWTPNPAVQTCRTCPRVMHTICLKFKIDRLTSDIHCPLCCKRGWHLIEPAFAMQQLNDDDIRMKRTARKLKWDDKFGESKQMAIWQTLHDDGTLDSGRRLLVDLKLVKPEHLKGARLVNEGTREVKQETRGIKRKSSSAHERLR